MANFDDALGSLYNPRLQSGPTGGGEYPGGFRVDPQGRSPRALQGTEFLQAGFQPMYGTVREASRGAGDLLRQSYENQFRARAGAAVGGMDEMQSRMMSGAAGSGMSQDVLQRMLYAPGMQTQQQVGQARAETEAGEGMDLSRLLKGTGSELAGIQGSEQAAILNWLTARGARHAASGSGGMDWGGLLGGVAGSLLGPAGGAIGGALGSGVGGMLGGGGRPSGGGGVYGDQYD